MSRRANAFVLVLAVAALALHAPQVQAGVGQIYAVLQSTFGGSFAVSAPSSGDTLIYDGSNWTTSSGASAGGAFSWLNVGTATDAAATGDFASGLVGGARIEYDVDQDTEGQFTIYDTGGTGSVHLHADGEIQSSWINGGSTAEADAVGEINFGRNDGLEVTLDPVRGELRLTSGSATAGPGLNVRQFAGWFVMDDFAYSGADPDLWQEVTAGTGSTAVDLAEGSGILQLETGATGSSSETTQSWAPLLSNAEGWALEVRARLSTTGALDTTDEEVRIGWVQESSGNEEAVFVYDDAENTGFWQAETVDSTPTAENTNTTVDAVDDTWFVLRIEFENDTTDTVTFLVNGTVRATHTTNIPAAASDGHLYWTVNNKAVAEDKRLEIDYAAIIYHGRVQ